MTAVTDLSPGTRLVADMTGYTYRVVEQSGDKTKVSGPHGQMWVLTEQLQADIAKGKIGVKN